MWILSELFGLIVELIFKLFKSHARREGRRADPADPYGWKRKADGPKGPPSDSQP